MQTFLFIFCGTAVLALGEILLFVVLMLLVLVFRYLTETK